jgi:DNA repair exonuclease SbcCD ATPase subunit
LRERLHIAKGELKKISSCGDDMDGNTSHAEEDEFIDALKEEMPEVFKNIEGNFDQLDKIDNMIEEVIKNRDIDTMQELKGQIDDAQTKVEQCEGLVNKLENEIIEWDATKKLCRRDEELGEIEGLLKEFRTDLKGERDAMKSGEEKQKGVLNAAKEQNDIDDANYLLEGVANYNAEINALEKDIDSLDDDRKECFGEFDADIPSSVKVERYKREAAAGKGKKVNASTASDKPEDMYYKLRINARYKKRIHDLLKRLRDINQKRRELMEKYAGLKKDLNVVKAPRMYKAVKGDPVDELWCWHLNKA